MNPRSNKLKDPDSILYIRLQYILPDLGVFISFFGISSNYGE